MEKLKDKIAIVTGGGGAIGAAICRRLAEEGAVVGVFDSNGAAARKVSEAILAAGGKADSVEADITKFDDVTSAVRGFEERHGGVSILINSAGWDIASNFTDTDPELWRRVIDINYVGVLNLHRAVLPGMTARQHGRIVNIASDAGRVGSSGEAVYSGCKAAVIAFGKAIARECATRSVTVNAVCPGPTDTPLFWSTMGDAVLGQKIAEGLKRAIPMRRMGTPEDFPGLVAFLASDEAQFITGQVISVSGGLTMHG